MRRPLITLALIAVPLTACGSGATTPAAQPTGAAVTSSGEPVMTSDGGSVSAMVESSGSMMQHPAPSMTKHSVPPSSAPVRSKAPTAGTTTGVTIMTAGSDFGDILFDGTGQAIYLFDKETTKAPDCYGECAVAWPPVLTGGSPVAGVGAKSGLLGTTPRTDGSTQATYAGHPLYYYAHEGKNEVTCHHVDEFGGLWLVVTPIGQAVT